MHARIQIYWCRSSIFRHLKLELLTQFPASNDEKYINVVYIWRKFVSFYGYVHWRMTTEISVMYGSEKVKLAKSSDRIRTNLFNLFTTIHDGNFRRHSSMNVTIKWHKFSSNIYYIYVFFVIWSWKWRRKFPSCMVVKRLSWRNLVIVLELIYLTFSPPYMTEISVVIRQWT